ncbi:ADP-ribosylglycohydrolase family protein [Lachnospiraceae bacterium 54-53]
MKKEYMEKIYAGWLAKIIGIRFGAPIEGWTYEKIRNIFGDRLDHYPAGYINFAADDDSNGPLFFLRALEDSNKGYDLTSQDVAEALLNYAPYEHGFFWWGGYGISTEHTAYLNLRNGIPAPRSGSIEQNGSTMAEQIGGQIFIDTWGLVTPGNPDKAARLAREAASVTHGGNGVYGGIFVAVCISCAFEETDIRTIIEKGLSYIPSDCEYARAVRAVMDYHSENPSDWRQCFRFVFENYGYDKYPGNCHIIPNIAVMILSLLYGEGDFDRTLEICNLCGWDTDCNVGNVAAIMGVVCGLGGISYEKWRKPVNDLLICSSVVGSLNIIDIPFGASYIAKMACQLEGTDVPEEWKQIIEKRIDSCHFEYPGSTHGIRMRAEPNDARYSGNREFSIMNTEETAFTGTRSLKFLARTMEPGENVYVYKQTYYRPEDFSDSRYDPCFSPLVYPGQTLYGSACIPEYGSGALVSLYARDLHTGIVYEGSKKELSKGRWVTLEFKIPGGMDALIGEIGFCFHIQGKHKESFDFTGFIDDLYGAGPADYAVDFAKEQEELWPGTVHSEISQFTKLKGNTYLQEGALHLSCADFGEVSTGGNEWEDYRAEFTLTPVAGECHLALVRVQGAMRSYGAGFMADGRFGILKNRGGYETAAWEPFRWEYGKEYKITVTVKNHFIEASAGDVTVRFLDEEKPYLKGGVGLSVGNGSHMSCRSIRVF